MPGSRESNLFRRDFCLPYAVFVELVALVEDLRWFPFTDGDLEPEEELKDVAGRRCIPLELKVREKKLLRCRVRCGFFFLSGVEEKLQQDNFFNLVQPFAFRTAIFHHIYACPFVSLTKTAVAQKAKPGYGGAGVGVVR